MFNVVVVVLLLLLLLTLAWWLAKLSVSAFLLFLWLVGLLSLVDLSVMSNDRLLLVLEPLLL